MLKFMSEALVPNKQKEYQAQVLEAAREKLSRYLGRAVEIITELAETSENDRVRLAAAQDIADRAGLTKSTTTNVQVSSAEHEAATKDAEDLVKRIQENQAQIAQGTVGISVDALIVHEAEEPVPTTQGV